MLAFAKKLRFGITLVLELAIYFWVSQASLWLLNQANDLMMVCGAVITVVLFLAVWERIKYYGKLIKGRIK